MWFSDGVDDALRYALHIEEQHGQVFKRERQSYRATFYLIVVYLMQFIDLGVVNVILCFDCIAFRCQFLELVRVTSEIVKAIAQTLVFFPEWSGNVCLCLLCITEWLDVCLEERVIIDTVESFLIASIELVASCNQLIQFGCIGKQLVNTLARLLYIFGIVDEGIGVLVLFI